MGDVTAAVAGLALVIAIVDLVLVLALIRARSRPVHGAIVAGAPAGTQVAPEAFQAVLDGPQAQRLRVGRSIVMFLSGECGGCPAVIDRLNERREDLAGVNLLIVEPEQSRLRQRAQFDATWVIDPARRLGQAFQNRMIPSAYVLDRGRIAQSGGAMEIERLLTAYRGTGRAAVAGG